MVEHFRKNPILGALLCVHLMACSAGNSPPTAPAISFEPETVTTVDDFKVVIATESEDPDGDGILYRYEWKVGTSKQADYSEKTTVLAQDTSKNELWQVTVTPEDTQGNQGPSTKASITIANTPPTGTVALVPENPDSSDPLEVSTTTDDIDGDEVAMILIWSQNEEPRGEFDGLTTLPASATAKGDSWTVSAVPDDGDSNGQGPMVEATVNIGNSAPSVDEVTLSPDAPVAGDTLSLEISTSDPDGDPVEVSIAWYKNSAVLEGATETTLAPEAFIKGDNIYAEVTPTDGVLKGAPEKSNSMKIENTPPTLVKISFSPAEGNETTVFTCIPEGWFDPDPDDTESYKYQWYVEGDKSVETETISGDHFDKGDKIYCEVTPTDGDDDGVARISGTTTIANFPPTMSGLKVTPDDGTSSDIFECTPVDPFDADSMDLITYQVQWFVNDEASVNTATINGDYFDKHDIIHCQSTPSDNFSIGTTTTSNFHEVLNTPPSLESTDIDPSTGTEETVFTCVPGTWSDVDIGDAKAFLYQWLVNNTPVDGATQATISGEHFNKHDMVSCVATPWDGEDEGLSVQSGTAVITNTIASIESITISPQDSYETSVLTCVPEGWWDPDTEDDPLFEFTWYRQRLGTDEIPIANTETLDGNFFQKGDRLSCKAIPLDEDAQGIDLKSEQITIINSPPIVNSVTIVPDTGTEETVFNCIPKGYSDPDPTDGIIFSYQWNVNDEPSVTTETISGSEFNKFDSLTCTVIPSDGETPGDATTSPETVVENTPPILEKVVLFPNLVFKSSLISCVPFNWFDPDELDVPDYIYQWLVNGDPVGTDSSLSRDYFNKHDTIQCTAIPTDGDSQGNIYESEEKTVINSIPTMNDAVIEPTAGTVETVFKCVPIDLNDNDPGDEVALSYQWYVNNAYSVTTETIDSAHFKKHDKIVCSIRPADEESQGTFKEALAVTVSNALPVVATVTATPDEAYETSTIYCESTGTSDPDGGLPLPSLSYHWEVNGEKVLEGTELTGAYFDRGDSIECLVTATDDEEAGIPVPSETIIASNTPPTVDSVSIEPTMPTSATPLVAVASGWNDPDPDTEDYLYRWVVNDNPLDINSPTLPTENFARGDSVYVVIFPDDGNVDPAAQPSKNSSSVTINNARPSQPLVAISPVYPKPNEELLCSVTEDSIDADGDDFHYQYHWTRNGELTGFDAEAIPANEVVEGETWACMPSGCDAEGCGVPGSASVYVTAMPVCGNSEVEDGEECDDGNNTDYDGCAANCLLEPMAGDRWNDRLVLWLPFTGNASDASASGHTVNINDATPATDRFGADDSAYSLNGTTYMEIPASNGFTLDEQEFTISLWIKPTGEMWNSTIIGQWATGATGNSDDAFSLSLHDSPDNSATLQWLHTTDGWSDKIFNLAPTFEEKWTHLVVRWSGSTLKAFKDNEEIGTTPATGIWSSSLPLVIGATANYDAIYEGAIDDVAIWKRALSNDEIQSLFLMGGFTPSSDEGDGSESQGDN